MGVAAERIQEQPLLEAVEEDEMDRGGRLAMLVWRSDLDHGPDRRLDPVNQQVTLALLVRCGRGHLHNAAAPLRIWLAILIASDQRPDQVDAVIEVVMLRVDVDAHQVGVLLW